MKTFILIHGLRMPVKFDSGKIETVAGPGILP
jgi:hypothetical protein